MASKAGKWLLIALGILLTAFPATAELKWQYDPEDAQVEVADSEDQTVGETATPDGDGSVDVFDVQVNPEGSCPFDGSGSALVDCIAEHLDSQGYEASSYTSPGTIVSIRGNQGLVPDIRIRESSLTTSSVRIKVQKDGLIGRIGSFVEDPLGGSRVHVYLDGNEIVVPTLFGQSAKQLTLSVLDALERERYDVELIDWRRGSRQFQGQSIAIWADPRGVAIKELKVWSEDPAIRTTLLALEDDPRIGCCTPPVPL
jgi:hypothetical protein